MAKFSSPPLPMRTKRSLWPSSVPKANLYEILIDICEIFGKTPEEVSSDIRPPELTACRQVYFYVANVLTNETCLAIAGFINKDHTTYFHDLKRSINGFETNDKKFMTSWVIYESQSTLWKTYYEMHINNAKKVA